MPPAAQTGRPVEGQEWHADSYARHARFVADLALPVVDLLAPKFGETILDLGCGDGALSLEIQRRGADLFAIDASPSMVQGARAMGLEAILADGTALPFADRFDAVFTNAVLHWIPDVEGVIGSVRRALKPGGRFVGEFGGHGCVAAILTALRAVARSHGLDETEVCPWYFPTVEDYRARLENGGFRVDYIALIPRPTPLPTGIDGWLETFRAPFFQQVSEAEREALRDEAIALIAPSLRDANGQWTADYVRLRFAAFLAD